MACLLPKAVSLMAKPVVVSSKQADSVLHGVLQLVKAGALCPHGFCLLV